MRRRVTTLVTGLVLMALGSSGAAMGALASVRVPASGNPVSMAAPYGGCADANPVNHFAGRSLGGSSGGFPFIGIKADITPDLSGFHNCVGATIFDPFASGGSSAWVALEEGSNNGDSIVQVGLIMCHNLFNAGPCSAPLDNTVRYFYAYGGCNGFTPAPRDGGAANGLLHHYEVVLVSGSYKAYVDGVQKLTIGLRHSAIGCWQNGNQDWPYFGERWDGADGLGNPSPATRFTAMQVKYNTGYHNISISGCGADPGDSACTATGNTMKVWTFGN